MIRVDRHPCPVRFFVNSFDSRRIIMRLSALLLTYLLSTTVFAVDYGKLNEAVDKQQATDSVDKGKAMEAVQEQDMKKGYESVDQQKAVGSVDKDKAMEALMK